MNEGLFHPYALRVFRLQLERGARVVLVGQAPGRTGDDSKPLTGRIMDRLCAASGVERWTYLRRAARINLLRDYPGKAGKGDRFPMAAAREAAGELALHLVGRKVIYLGVRVAQAFDFNGAEALRWVGDEAWMPHPSGVNVWWNLRANREAAGRFLREVLA